MKICMLLADHDFPPDIRVEKEARALVSAGHELTVLCDKLTFKNDVDYFDGCKIIRYQRQKTVYAILEMLFFLLFFRDPKWEKFLAALHEREQFSCFHVHDLRMLGPTLNVAKRYGVPVVSDLHENCVYSYQMYLDTRPLWKRVCLNLISPYWRWVRYEKRCLLLADRVIVVVKEAMDRLAQLGIPSNKIHIVENTEDSKSFLRIPIQQEVLDEYAGYFVILFIGGFGAHRGLDVAIRAMPQIVQVIPNARLLLVGKGPNEGDLKGIVSELGVGKYVEFKQWQPFEKVPSYISVSSICIVPHNSNQQTEATSPHKLFQYMMLKKPVLVSSCKPIARTIKETGGGRIFQAGSIDSYIEEVLKLRDSSTRQSIGEAGFRSVIETHNWEATSRKLIDIYSRSLAMKE